MYILSGLSRIKDLSPFLVIYGPEGDRTLDLLIANEVL